ncbi:MAG: hypothetical protein LUF87_06985 [Alistipes sp.]|nr:hypothetical protein [Alistipes sp.]
MDAIKLAKRIRGLLQERFPGNYNYVPLLSDILGVHEKTVHKKLRGDTQFSMMELYTIGKKLDVPFGELFNETAHPDKYPMEIYMQDFSNGRENDELMRQTLDAFSLASSSENCRYYIAANTVPDIVFADYPWIARFSYMKWVYFTKGVEHTTSVSEVEFNETSLDFYRRYRDYIHSSSRTIYILHVDMTRTIAEDLLFFYKIHVISEDEARQVTEDLYKLIDNCEKLCNKGIIERRDREVYFFFSKILLPNDVIIIESDELNLVNLYANYHNPITSTGINTFNTFRQWFSLWMHSSNIISASDPEQRYEFFQKQREYLEEMQEKIAGMKRD